MIQFLSKTFFYIINHFKNISATSPCLTWYNIKYIWFTCPIYINSNKYSKSQIFFLNLYHKVIDLLYERLLAKREWLIRNMFLRIDKTENLNVDLIIVSSQIFTIQLLSDFPGDSKLDENKVFLNRFLSKCNAKLKF